MALEALAAELKELYEAGSDVQSTTVAVATSETLQRATTLLGTRCVHLPGYSLPEGVLHSKTCKRAGGSCASSPCLESAARNCLFRTPRTCELWLLGCILCAGPAWQYASGLVFRQAWRGSNQKQVV